MSNNFIALLEQTCPVCGQNFVFGNEWIYKVHVAGVGKKNQQKTYILCTYSCWNKAKQARDKLYKYRKLEKEKEKIIRENLMTPEDFLASLEDYLNEMNIDMVLDDNINQIALDKLQRKINKMRVFCNDLKEIESWFTTEYQNIFG